MSTTHHDAVVVGGRCAGAATALLLAEAGLDVLLLESGRRGTDTLSTHALMRGAVVQLDRWGLLEEIVAAGTPAIRATEFHYGEDTVTVAARPGSTPLRAPRRTVLDPVLLDAAQARGADVRCATRVTDVVRDASGRVRGVEYAERGTGTTGTALAPITIGADGRRSTIAEAVDAGYEHRGHASGALLLAYWSGFGLDRYRWFYGPGVTAGVVPTNDGRACVWAGAPSDRFDTLRGQLDTGYRDLLAEAAPALAGEMAGGRMEGPVRGFRGVPGHRRTAAGPGWALVGDAGYFKDPLTAHGITDALRDAELLARAVLAAPSPGAAQRDALRGYQETRDRLSAELEAITERLASYAWDLTELRDLLPALSRSMQPEVEALRALDRPVELAA
ncbi:NAD(P)/FAD-dependent oxidoreductase [Actinomycetospora sp. TBRC 11914]|uniref:NAD(P)/FAD-dependent oxidoreductase n=1 Tax=Actinomycetospora sp. TBRC 11914 TaxID=2729387 RepID=UPI00145DD7CC|nr:FAD-dependent monooxygenase [Actinomycetospora sp. TBRC 11914]NMO92710.1 NAD(P)/FAD-dependent oxidoreductase [Actinomycetospora sp. TBRC 11914]